MNALVNFQTHIVRRRAQATSCLIDSLQWSISMKCQKCGQEMSLEEKDTSSGRDMRSYYCKNCKKEHIVDFGDALWKVLSDGRKSDG